MTPPEPVPPVEAPVRRSRYAAAAVVAVVAIALVLLVVDEVRTSRHQAAWLAGVAARLHHEVRPGPSPSIRFPGNGPFDQRLGYDRLPAWVDRLQALDFRVERQARMSPTMVQLIDQGLFPIYHEKTSAGLSVLDCRGDSLFDAPEARRLYGRFEAVPPLLVEALLFIENRALLDPDAPATRNPALEWPRLGRAMADHLVALVDPSHETSGGSTLATQMEKYRHSPEGRTASPGEKLRQVASASVRAYLDGEDTLPRRRQIVADYLDTVPLAAQAGVGEVNGLGDGLWAWYGRDFDALNATLRNGRPDDPAVALAFKQALSLMVAQRRPSRYLLHGHEALRRLTDSHLRLMADAGVIPAALRDAALPLPLDLRTQATPPAASSFVERKAGNAVRARLQSLLAVPRAYDLDRLDLSVRSALDGQAQRAATALLRSLREPAGARAAGLYGHRLLASDDDPGPIAFSFTLFERGEHSNLLRVQADNVDQPFDMNEGGRMDLGSTAKLRTLVTYLELVARLHARWSGLSAKELAALPIARRDALGRWARDHLARGGDRGLATMLEAAMERRYSASPHEAFLTGGGLHTFGNFEPEDDHRTMTVREAFTRSVNLVFIRLMRDVVHHLMGSRDGETSALLDDPSHPGRRAWLARFADQEGREFVARFYRRHAGTGADEAQARMLAGVRPTPKRVAAVVYGIDPAAEDARLADALARHVPGADRSPQTLRALRAQHGTGRWSLADRGYLAGRHPLELWVVGYLQQHPGATLADVLRASAEARQEAYGWLFKTRHKNAQDTRIRRLLEAEAFDELLHLWRRLGYPFDSITPSYASAVGASGDRPAALAELMGVIVNGGMRLPVTRIATLDFASATPFETRLAYAPPAGERVLPVELTDTVRRALVGVVEQGTARRLKGALTGPDGQPIVMGAKTGTGDHRLESRGEGGRLLASRVVARSATAVFLVGDRWFGTVTAYVREPHAEHYTFTSSMVVQLLKAMTPALSRLPAQAGCRPAADVRH